MTSNMLIPALRKYVDTKLTKFYNTLVKKYKVDTKESLLFQPEQYGFQYQDQEKYVIKNHNELAKFYMDSNMAKHFKTVLDESTDASAVLGIMGRCSVFSKKEKDLANNIRKNVRNKWGHCKISEWTKTKFLESFKLMIQLVKAFPNSFKDKYVTVEKLES